MSPTPKTPNNDAVGQIAEIIVSKEVTRILGPAGARDLMKIGALLKLIHPLYQAYYDALDTAGIRLDTVQQYFSPGAWTALTNPKRRLLEAGIRKEVESVKKQIQTHMLYLRKNEAELATLNPAGQAMLESVLRELMGEEVSAL
ncbi:hypothetical protein [Hymenobacter sp. PAMC 26628]|uniref:hypothetical protein n=1 Tax=Hymenobacter sp. PAMC 26628 TaxID=1484118 RepID=UPI0007701032|nr:hypothetical protein [Hymenobacter sp. PAMC 26628]AMJ65023.1 hypothetical protein AXW84_05980 [Hymenobacter sp. PAMC 26628]